jgi:hypothetical protein
MEFTHQGVFNSHKRGVSYPNAEKGWNGNLIRDVMKPVREFQQKHGARIYVGEFSAIAWAKGAENYLRDCISLFEEYGWDWCYHAFREWEGWSVEHEGDSATTLRRVGDTPRKKVLIDGLRGRAGK